MNENECRDSYNEILEVLREVGLVSLVESVEETIREGKMTFNEKNDSEIEIYQEGEKLQLLLEAVERTFKGRIDMIEYIRELDEIRANEIQEMQFREPESTSSPFVIQIYDQENGSNAEEQFSHIFNVIRELKTEINQ